MAVRSLGCPVRFILTAGQQRDCPQAYALIDGLPAKVVVADAAYDAERQRLDPNYAPQIRYADMTARADQSTRNAQAISSNLDALNANTAQLVREYQQRNQRH